MRGRKKPGERTLLVPKKDGKTEKPLGPFESLLAFLEPPRHAAAPSSAAAAPGGRRSPVRPAAPAPAARSLLSAEELAAIEVAKRARIEKIETDCRAIGDIDTLDGIEAAQLTIRAHYSAVPRMRLSRSEAGNLVNLLRQAERSLTQHGKHLALQHCQQLAEAWSRTGDLDERSALQRQVFALMTQAKQLVGMETAEFKKVPVAASILVKVLPHIFSLEERIPILVREEVQTVLNKAINAEDLSKREVAGLLDTLLLYQRQGLTDLPVGERCKAIATVNSALEMQVFRDALARLKKDPEASPMPE